MHSFFSYKTLSLPLPLHTKKDDDSDERDERRMGGRGDRGGGRKEPLFSAYPPSRPTIPSLDCPQSSPV
jgi:hypothetical protein